jgi:hypothetical protein
MVLMLVSISNYAQDKYQVLKSESTLKVLGTSSLHDWEMTVNDYSGFVTVKSAFGNIDAISDGRFSCKAVSILSKEKLMDKKAHEALKADKNPEIVFTTTSVQLSAKTAAGFSGEITGNMSIAGKTNVVKIPFTGKLIGSDKMEVKGIFPLKESDFGMTPPTALMGALKTGDDIKIDYKIVFVKEAQTAQTK